MHSIGQRYTQKLNTFGTDFVHSKKKIISVTRNLRTNNVSIMY